jgi:5-methyltetrahydropteroyltriglutamate--homocysteine methyltransferase
VKLLKTVIGSFPPKELPLEDAVRWAIDVQLRHGVDIVSDGEQRGDMINYFSFIPGLEVGPHGPYVKSRVLPVDDPRSFAKLQDLRLAEDYLRTIGREDVKVKVSVTGPITLGFACAANGLKYYSSLGDVKLYNDFAQALNPLILELARTGCYVQIDEPSLSVGVMNAKDAVRIVNIALSHLPTLLRREGRLSVHICGPLTEALFKDFLKLDAPVLSLAFSTPNVRKNLELVRRRALEEAEKKLGVGCVSAQVPRADKMERLDVVIQRLKTVRESVGTELIAYLHPDCGMRNTDKDAVEPILEMLNSAAHFLEQNA